MDTQEKAAHLKWSSERVAVVEKFYEKSQSHKSKKDPAALRDEMLREVNELPGKKVGVNAIRCMAREQQWGVWGWNPNSEENTAKAALKLLLKDMEARIAEMVRQGALVSIG